MSKPRLTKEQKKIRRDLLAYHRNLPVNKEARKASRKLVIGTIVAALAVQELIKGDD